MDYAQVKEYLHSFIQPEKVAILSSFFKTGPGEYAEGDKFLGITVPNTRRVIKKSKKLSVDDILLFVRSEWHEERLLGLLLLERRFRFAKDSERKYWVDLYLDNLQFVNNWDLVDQTADKILGEYLAENKDYSVLLEFADSTVLWERRVAILSTFAFLRRKNSGPTYELAEKLMLDSHDLMHKAVGWLIREAGKRVDEPEMIEFIRKNRSKMPRTMLRYAIERLPEELRQELMKK